MFSKYATLLAFTASAIAAVQPGLYLLTNVASQSTARTYQADSPVYVSSTRESPGPFELWNITSDSGDKDGSYTFENFGLHSFADASPSPGEAVITDSKGAAFNIESVGDGQYVIKLPNQNLLWNVEPPIIPRGDIKLRPADGSPRQRWTLTRTPSNSGQDD